MVRKSDMDQNLQAVEGKTGPVAALKILFTFVSFFKSFHHKGVEECFDSNN